MTADRENNILRSTLMFITANILILWIQQNFFMDPEQIRTFMEHQGMRPEGIGTALFLNEKILLFNYILSPLLYILKAGLVTLFLQLIFLLLRQQHSFRLLFIPALSAEYAVVAKYFSRQLSIYFSPVQELTVYSMHHIPLSIQTFLEAPDFPVYAWQLLGIPSLFSLAWLLILGISLKRRVNGKYSDMLLISAGLWTVSYILRWALLNILEILK